MKTHPDFLSASYWDERYQQQQTGWDIGYASTPLKTYIDQLTDKDVRILLPGAGNAYEARYLCDKGFTDITVLDISTVVITRLQAQLGEQYPAIKLVTGNFFDHSGTYDLVLEQTFFCALDPALRQKYVAKMHSLLSGNGKLAGLLFNRDFEKSPPFGGNTGEYRQLFSSVFRMVRLEPCYNSIPERTGNELFLLAQK
ncbi:MAG: methyltransferase domain-containing protein [Bacteroidetes bacterium]|nr:methyltransferase domain-containing protein [Bacteroidota bacterium]